MLDIGGVMLTELNTGLWGAALDTDQVVCIHDNWVRSGTKVFVNVAIDDVLDALIREVTARAAATRRRPRRAGDDRFGR